MNNLFVNNIFQSIQGEGIWTGMPMTFLRLQGCNLHCSFCDTPEALAPQGGVDHDPQELARTLAATDGTGVVCITGGEPTMQLSPLLVLTRELAKSGIVCHLETNGTVRMSEEQCTHFGWITISPKPPLFECLIPYECVNEVKLVMGAKTETRGDYADEVVISRYLRVMADSVPVWLQPDNNRSEAIQWILSLLYRGNGQACRLGLSVQTHKLIGID